MVPKQHLAGSIRTRLLLLISNKTQITTVPRRLALSGFTRVLTKKEPIIWTI